MPRHTAVRLDSPLAAEFLRGLDRVGSRFGVLLEGGDVWEADVLPDGDGLGALVGKETGMPSAERVTAVRQVTMDALSWSTIHGNPEASKSVPNSAPLSSR